MTSRLAVASATVAILLFGVTNSPLTPATSAFAQQSQPSGRGQQTATMQDMMKMHEQMMAQMKAADAKLDQLVQKMDSATGDAKVNATADVVKELVTQNKAMHDHIGQMHQQMMSGRGMMMHK